MLDFRYHALSLVAVFLALGIGIVLGSSLGDTVVSQANRDIANSLRGDLAKSRRDASGAHAAVGQRERALEAAFTRIADSKLSRRTVALVAAGRLGDAVQSGVRDAVRGAGGELGAIAEVQSPPDIAALGAAVGPRFENLRSDDPRLRPLGRRIGEALVRGGGLARRLHDRFPDRFGGRTAPADAVVIYRDPTQERSAAVKRIEQGLIDGVRAAATPVVGVETADTDPSQISFYANQGLSTVDDVDSAGGRIALVLALAGARGNFGFKDTASAPLPPAKGG
jgi:hypothetical protein